MFKELPKNNSKYKLGGDSEFKYTDNPVLKKGGYRLSTYDNYAYHIGNKIDDFIIDKFKSLKTNINKENKNYSKLNVLKSSKIEYILSEFIIKKIISLKKLKNYY